MPKDTLTAEALMHYDIVPANEFYSGLRPPAALADSVQSIWVQPEVSQISNTNYL